MGIIALAPLTALGLGSLRLIVLVSEINSVVTCDINVHYVYVYLRRLIYFRFRHLLLDAPSRDV